MGSHCYTNNDFTTWLYTAADGTSPLQMVFAAGGIESPFDEITIYDGINSFAPVLYDGNNSGDLTGLTITSTGPNLYFEIDSDSFGSCDDSSFCCMTPWEWTVSVGTCISCSTTDSHCYGNNDATTWTYTAADGTSALELMFTAGGIESPWDEITIYDGTNNFAPVLFDGNNGGDLTGLTITSTGPNLYFEIDSDGIGSCDDGSFCCMTPWEWTVSVATCTTVSCNAAGSHCYSNNDLTNWLYAAADGTSALQLMFTAGDIDVFDGIRMFDGTDNLSPLLYNGNNGGDLTGLTISSTGPNLYFEIDSDSFFSCDDGSFCCAIEWDWTVDMINACAPVNDECVDAIALTVNTDLSCTVTTAGSTIAATASPQVDDVIGVPDNDVWFSFVATSENHQVDLLNVVPLIGSNPLLGMALYDGTLGCAAIVFVDDSEFYTAIFTGLNIGTTYILRVYGLFGGAASTQADFNVCVSPLSCLDITDLTFVSSTLTTVDLSWTAGYTETVWDIEVLAPGVTPTGIPTFNDVSNPFTVTGLMPANDYSIYVRADCGMDDVDVGGWEGVSVYTLCELEAPSCGSDYTMDFDGSASSVCWIESSGPISGPTGSLDNFPNWWVDEFPDGSGNFAGSYFFYSTSNQEWYTGPTFDLSGGSNYMLSFDIGLTGNTALGSDDQVQLLITNDAGASWTNLMTWDANSVIPNAGQTVSLDLSAYTGLVQFGWWATDGTVSDSPFIKFFFDNFTVQTSVCNPCPAGAPAPDLTTGLVSYWNFDTNVLDQQGSNDGTIVGSGSMYSPAVFSDGIDLDGGTTYINVGNDASLNMTNSSLTISAWFRVDAFTDFWQTLISKGEGQNFRIARDVDSDSLAYNGGNFPDVLAPVNINDGLFHHVAAVTDNGVAKYIYIDGILQGTDNTGTILTDTGFDLLIGNNPAILSRDWNGMIDDVAIWNTPLSDCAIHQLFNSGMSLGDMLACPPEYTTANGNQLMGSETGTVDYETDGSLESIQTIGATATVDYDSGSDITLLQGFEVLGGAVFHAFIDGCMGAMLQEEQDAGVKQKK